MPSGPTVTPIMPLLAGLAGLAKALDTTLNIAMDDDATAITFAPHRADAV